VARFAAGLNAFQRTGSWFFFVTGAPSPLPTPPQAYNDSRTYASVTTALTGEDYIGLLVGEASGNWNPAIHPRGVNGPERSASVTAPQLVTPADGEVMIPIAVRGAANKEIISYEFDLRYDPAVIQPQADPVDVLGTASRGLLAVANPNEPGLLRVVLYGISPIDGNGVLLNLRFTAVGAPGTASSLTFERFMFNEGDPGTLVTDGQVELSASAPNQAELTGRIVNSMGQGMPMARVTLTDTTGAIRTASTDSFGVYRFGGLTVGQTYTVNAASRSLKATPTAVSITSQSARADLIAQ
jgi:Cohesin domain/Carboxypeptidase regulatory-like domain